MCVCVCVCVCTSWRDSDIFLKIECKITRLAEHTCFSNSKTQKQVNSLDVVFGRMRLKGAHFPPKFIDLHFSEK